MGMGLHGCFRPLGACGLGQGLLTLKPRPLAEQMDGNDGLVLPFQGPKAPEALFEPSTASLWTWTATPRPATNSGRSFAEGHAASFMAVTLGVF